MTTQDELYIEKLYAALCKRKGVNEPIRELKELEAKGKTLTAKHNLARHIVTPRGEAYLPFEGVVDFITPYVDNNRDWGVIQFDKETGWPVVHVWQFDSESLLTSVLAGKSMNKRFGQMVSKIAAFYLPKQGCTLKIKIAHASEEIKEPQVGDAFELPVIKAAAFKSDSVAGALRYFDMVLARKMRLYVEQAIEDKCDVLVIATTVTQNKKSKGVGTKVAWHYKGSMPDWEKPFSRKENEIHATEIQASLGGPVAAFDEDWEVRQQTKNEESKSTST